MTPTTDLQTLRAGFARKLKAYREGRPCSDTHLAAFIDAHAAAFFSLLPVASRVLPLRRLDPVDVDLGAMVSDGEEPSEEELLAEHERHRLALEAVEAQQASVGEEEEAAAWDVLPRPFGKPADFPPIGGPYLLADGSVE